MLWLKIVRREGADPKLSTFTVHGLVTVPTALAGATLALWVALHVVGT